MLRVTSFAETQIAIVAVDNYIPIQARFPDVTDPVPLYWRTGDLKRQLIEVCLNPATGAVCRITVVMLGSEVRFNEPDVAESVRRVAGVPICDISRWPPDALNSEDRLRDEVARAEVGVGKNSLTLRFNPGPEAALYSAGSVQFGVSEDGELTLIHFAGLTAEEIDTITRRIPRD